MELSDTAELKRNARTIPHELPKLSRSAPDQPAIENAALKLLKRFRQDPD